jgi:hypothetical protein
MKHAGFPPHIAARGDAAASMRAAIMPPMMGAGAFVMSEMTDGHHQSGGYSRHSLLLVGRSHDLVRVAQLGLRGLSAEELPRARCLGARLVLVSTDCRFDRRVADRLFAAACGALGHGFDHRRELDSQRNTHGRA